MNSATRKIGKFWQNGSEKELWVYDLGPFTSHTFLSERAAKAALTKHKKRGLSKEWYRRNEQNNVK